MTVPTNELNLLIKKGYFEGTEIPEKFEVSVQKFIDIANEGWFDANHETVDLDYFGNIVKIDKDLCDIIQRIWKKNIKTNYSCQGDEHNSAYITLSKNNLRKLLNEFPAVTPVIKVSIFVNDKITPIDSKNLNTWIRNNRDMGEMCTILFRLNEFDNAMTKNCVILRT